VLAFPPIIAPVKAALLPLSGKDEFMPVLAQIARALTQLGVSQKPDTSGASIGRRYARADEIGAPHTHTHIHGQRQTED
jgi:glycyl-tRNA synthetase